MNPVQRLTRADAVRNRERLVAAAELEFRDHGTDASVAEIARRAGVAKGTVFRHFASKDELLIEVVRAHIDTLIDHAQSLAAAPDPGAALLEFLTVAGEQRQQNDVSFLLRDAAGQPAINHLQDRLTGAVDALVDRAREAGAIRSDVTGADIILLICAPIHVAEHAPDAGPDLWRRYLAIIYDGLRPEGAHPLPPRA